MRDDKHINILLRELILKTKSDIESIIEQIVIVYKCK